MTDLENALPDADLTRVMAVLSGSVAGTAHTLPMMPGSKNNQDAYLVHHEPGFLAGVVCDGCGSGLHSEVGAWFGARMILSVIRDMRFLGTDIAADTFWPLVTAEVTAGLRNVLNAARPSGYVDTTAMLDIVGQHLLFTAVGFVMTPETTQIFGLGDGVWALNGEVTEIPPFEGNAPPYLSYRLIKQNPDRYLLQKYREVPTADVESLLVGSDGVGDLIKQADKTLPGKSDLIGPLSQFWDADRGTAWVQRRLNLINDDSVKVDWERRQLKRESGRLPDDTTLIAVRRRAAGEAQP